MSSALIRYPYGIFFLCFACTTIESVNGFYSMILPVVVFCFPCTDIQPMWLGILQRTCYFLDLVVPLSWCLGSVALSYFSSGAQRFSLSMTFYKCVASLVFYSP